MASFPSPGSRSSSDLLPRPALQGQHSLELGFEGTGQEISLLFLRSLRKYCKTNPHTPLLEPKSTSNSEFFPREDHRGQQNPEGTKSRSGQRNSGECGCISLISFPSREQFLPKWEVTRHSLWDDPEPASGQVKTVERQLLVTSFYPAVAGLGPLLVLDQTTAVWKTLRRPVHTSHPWNAWPPLCPQVGWVPSIATVSHQFSMVGRGWTWNCRLGWDLVRGITNPYFSDTSVCALCT